MIEKRPAVLGIFIMHDAPDHDDVIARLMPRLDPAFEMRQRLFQRRITIGADACHQPVEIMIPRLGHAERNILMIFAQDVDGAHGAACRGWAKHEGHALAGEFAGIGDGVLEADGVPIYWAQDLRVGLYQRP